MNIKMMTNSQLSTTESRIVFDISEKNFIGILVGIVLNL